jgi:hypothetical protein
MNKTILNLGIILFSILILYPLYAQLDLPQVDISANKENINSYEPVIISVRVNNKTANAVDMYAVVLYKGTFYFYPTWDMNPTAKDHITTVPAGMVWDKPIINVPFFMKATGVYTFYVALTEAGTSNLIGFDSVTVYINPEILPDN